MKNYGIKIARQGTTSLSSDNQLLYSSAFPTMSILFSQVLADTGRFNHALGYEPVFWYQDTYSILNLSAPNTQVTTFQNRNVTVDKQVLYNDLGFGTATRFYIFNRPIRTKLIGSTIQSLPIGTNFKDRNFGFEVSTPSKDIKSVSLDQKVSFSGYSSAGFPIRHLIVHQSDFQDNIATGTTVTYAHNLGYIPLFLAFSRNNGTTQYYLRITPFNYASPLPFQTTVSSSTLVFSNNSGSSVDYAYIIFKDPFN